MSQEAVYHIPALLSECLDGMQIEPQGRYVDVTFGGGGHSRAILSRLGDKGSLYAFDQDADAEQNIPDDERFTFIRGNFRFLKNFMRYHEVDQVDAILADLGVSFHHFDDPERGFSFRFGGGMDMRMNQRAGKSATDILNTYSEEKLSDIFYLYGELRSSRRIASAIVRYRSSVKIKTTEQFLQIVSPFINRKQEKKELAQLFQALRIEVNGEMESIKKLLEQSTAMLRPGGRLVIMTYHSLEDRLVKNYFKTGNFEGKVESDFFGRVKTPMRALSNKVIIASDEEVARNPRSRSAKLRIAEKLEE